MQVRYKRPVLLYGLAHHAVYRVQSVIHICVRAWRGAQIAEVNDGNRGGRLVLLRNGGYGAACQNSVPLHTRQPAPSRGAAIRWQDSGP